MSTASDAGRGLAPYWLADGPLPDRIVRLHGTTGAELRQEAEEAYRRGWRWISIYDALGRQVYHYSQRNGLWFGGELEEPDEMFLRVRDAWRWVLVPPRE